MAHKNICEALCVKNIVEMSLFSSQKNISVHKKFIAGVPRLFVCISVASAVRLLNNCDVMGSAGVVLGAFFGHFKHNLTITDIF